MYEQHLGTKPEVCFPRFIYSSRCVMANLLKFYFDFLSPLSRPFCILFEHAKIRCEMIPVALRKGEHLTETFGRDVNRFHKLPVINDDGFSLSESVAIFHYLGRKEIIPERWYPRDLKSLTRIDEYLQWQHNNLFMGAGMLFYMQLVEPLRTGKLPSQEQIERQKRTLIRCLDDLENIWLNDNKFLVANEITFADLMAASSIEQLIGMRLFKLDEDRHAKVKIWLESVRQFFGQNFKDAHMFVYRYGEKLSEKSL